jgi:hypothetical protein
LSDANMLAIGALPFQALAEQNERLIELARELRARPEAGQVNTGIDFRNYQSGACLEVFVECGPQDGDPLCWWIDVRWAGRWTISPRISRQDGTGQIILREFPERSADDAVQFARELAIVVDAIIESAMHMDLATR